MKNNMRIQLVPNLKLEQKQKYNSTQEKYYDFMKGKEFVSGDAIKRCSF